MGNGFLRNKIKLFFGLQHCPARPFSEDEGRNSLKGRGEEVVVRR